MEFGHLLAGEAVAPRKDQNQRFVQQKSLRIAEPAQARILGEGRGPDSALAASHAAGPEIRTTATPALPRALARAKIVSIRLAHGRGTPGQVFIESKNSAFVLVCLSFEIRNSMASVVPIGFRIRRKTKVF